MGKLDDQCCFQQEPGRQLRHRSLASSASSWQLMGQSLKITSMPRSLPVIAASNTMSRAMWKAFAKDGKRKRILSAKAVVPCFTVKLGKILSRLFDGRLLRKSCHSSGPPVVSRGQIGTSTVSSAAFDSSPAEEQEADESKLLSFQMWK